MDTLHTIGSVICRFLLSFALGALVFSGERWVRAEEPQKIRVGYAEASEYFLIPLLAREVGIFKKYGLDVEPVLIRDSGRAVQALLVGDVDYVVAAVTPLLEARIRGGGPVILAATSNYTSQRLMVRYRSGIRRLPELDGKAVGVSRFGSEGDTFLRTLLRRTGLVPDTDVTIYETGGDALTIQALAAGRIEAGCVGSAAVVAARQIGATELANGADRNVFALTGTLATTQGKIRREREQVAKFMSGYVEAIHFFKTNRDASLRVMQKVMGRLGAETLSALYDQVKDAYQPLPTPSYEAIQAALDRETDTGVKTFDATDFVDLSFLDAIERSGFVEELYQ